MLVEVKANAKFFIENGAELFANEPIRSVCLERTSLKDLRTLAAVPGVQRMSWISIAPDEELVEAALQLFPKVSIDLQEPDQEDIGLARGMAGGERVRGVSLTRARKPRLEYYAKLPVAKALARVDIADFICALTSPEYRTADDANEVFEFGWNLAWVSTRFVTPQNLAKLRAKVPDVAMRYD